MLDKLGVAECSLWPLFPASRMDGHVPDVSTNRSQCIEETVPEGSMKRSRCIEGCG